MKMIHPPTIKDIATVKNIVSGQTGISPQER